MLHSLPLLPAAVGAVAAVAGALLAPAKLMLRALQAAPSLLLCLVLLLAR
jgi:hypothetical protein